MSQQGFVSAIRVQPVTLPSVYFAQIDARFRQLVADTGVANIRKEMSYGIFKRPTGAAAASIRGKVDGTAVVWWSDLPHVGAQEKGVKPHAMWYLLNRTIPIKMYSLGGEQTLFRKATLKSFMMGKWYHRGYPGKFFMKKGVDVTVRQIPELFKKAQDDIAKGI